MSDIDKELLVDGFRFFNGNYSRKTIGRFEKHIITDDGKTKYFIHIYKYLGFVEGTYNYEAESQMMASSGMSFNINIDRINYRPLNDLNKFFEDLWVKMECKYY